MTPDEADLLFDGLNRLLTSSDDERLNAVVRDVQATIARGRPAAAEVKVGTKRVRERVRRVEPLDALERLRILVRAIELALVAPVELMASTFENMRSAEYPEFDLVFETDSAEADVVRTSRRTSVVDQQARLAEESIVITTRDVDSAREAVGALAAALKAIKADLDS